MNTQATSNYERILDLGIQISQSVSTARISDMLDFAKLTHTWQALEGAVSDERYDIFRTGRDLSSTILRVNLRKRLHYLAIAAVLGYQHLLAASSAVVETHSLMIATTDRDVLYTKGVGYGDSWKKRGGIGAFMMLARKWDRIEVLLCRYSGAVLLEALQSNPANVMDDIHDLRRYLLLVEDEIAAQEERRRADD